MKAWIFGTILFCVVLIGGGIYFATRPHVVGPRTIPLDPSYVAREKAGGWVEGNPDAKVKIIEYGDLQCPACGALYPILKKTLADTADITQFTFRHYPLPQHNKSNIAAIAAEAAGRQGKFWQMEDLLYTKQADWEESTTFDFNNMLNDYASSIGLDLPQFKNDLEDSSIQDEIDKDVKNGNQVPVQGTPTILINGQVLNQLPTTSDQFTQLIQQVAKNVK